MTDQAVAVLDKRADHLASLPRKRRALVEAMVWEGLRLKDAAVRAGMHIDSARIAVRQPEVQKALRDETQVLRSSAKPRAITRLSELADQDEHKSAAVMAAKALLADDEHGRMSVNINITPGYAVDLGERARAPLIEGEVIRVDDAAEVLSAEPDE